MNVWHKSLITGRGAIGARGDMLTRAMFFRIQILEVNNAKSILDSC